jgi:hypothetical protein
MQTLLDVLITRPAAWGRVRGPGGNPRLSIKEMSMVCRMAYHILGCVPMVSDEEHVLLYIVHTEGRVINSDWSSLVNTILPVFCQTVSNRVE